MKKMQIFEPAMCCSTGLCGVSVDLELLRISTLLSALEKNGIQVERYNLSGSPQEFVKNKAINDYIKKKGAEGLPAVVIDDEIVITGRYPSNDEFVKLLNIPDTYIRRKTVRARASKVTIKKSGGCGCSDGGCC
ncbi:arsenite efflux transporter metallochaperone ArsD [Anaerocolumna sp.]|uniref:arsenite efflux transporter metallochaperone ArsD n=1 Tax=Anaerocolumna sp. TaxID=2041569 RepID=UPI0028A789E6|nr:arsenite efflux transporter metallochaperone ArsD [Anaerocolumna sp.]